VIDRIAVGARHRSRRRVLPSARLRYFAGGGGRLAIRSGERARVRTRAARATGVARVLHRVSVAARRGARIRKLTGRIASDRAGVGRGTAIRSDDATSMRAAAAAARAIVAFVIDAARRVGGSVLRPRECRHAAQCEHCRCRSQRELAQCAASGRRKRSDGRR